MKYLCTHTVVQKRPGGRLADEESEEVQEICVICGLPVSADADKCPHCGSVFRKRDSQGDE